HFSLAAIPARPGEREGPVERRCHERQQYQRDRELDQREAALAADLVSRSPKPRIQLLAKCLCKLVRRAAPSEIRLFTGVSLEVVEHVVLRVAIDGELVSTGA